MELPDRYLAIDEEGYPLLGETRITDTSVGAEIFRHLTYASNNAFMTSVGGTEVLVEAFDEPFVAQQVYRVIPQGSGASSEPHSWRILLPYGVEFSWHLDTLSVDEWDRFHGYTDNKIPFVFSRKAQAAFFEMCEEFDDDSVTLDGKTYVLPPWLTSYPAASDQEFWSNIYRSEAPAWDLGKPAPGLVDLLPRLRLPKSRVLILGCGPGNDAAYFAEHGHNVTAIDVSSEALQEAKKRYGHLQNIKWIEADLFNLGSEYHKAYDLVFEHTCYCAIDPSRRNELVMQWRKCLVDGGFLLGIFFAMERKQAPPFGGTEWELRERLKKNFQFFFWGRLHNSIDRRNGKELLVYAQKK
jgi:SAM-dependent methyltransferase